MAITLDQLCECMPGLKRERAATMLPHLVDAMSEFEISHTVARAAAFLAQLGHESNSLKWMEELASGAAYEGRKDLGNTHPGDGRRYKGRGVIMLTGRANYRRYGALLGLGLEEHPEQAATPQVGFRIAGAFWQAHGLNALADEGRFEQITRRINGGTNGAEDRNARYQRCLKALR